MAAVKETFSALEGAVEQDAAEEAMDVATRFLMAAVRKKRCGLLASCLDNDVDAHWVQVLCEACTCGEDEMVELLLGRLWFEKNDLVDIAYETVQADPPKAELIVQRLHLAGGWKMCVRQKAWKNKAFMIGNSPYLREVYNPLWCD